MTLELLNITRNILKNISDNNIITIINNNYLETQAELKLRNKSLVISKNISIKDLKLFTRINSLPDAVIPNFELTDDDSVRLKKALDLEWKSPRMILRILLGNNNEWIEIGTLSLISPGDFNYRQYDLLSIIGSPIEIGMNYKLGIQLINVGYGHLKPIDTVNIYGYYIDEYYIDNPVNTSIINPDTDTDPNPITNTSNWTDINESQWNNLTTNQWELF